MGRLGLDEVISPIRRNPKNEIGLLHTKLVKLHQQPQQFCEECVELWEAEHRVDVLISHNPSAFV